MSIAGVPIALWQQLAQVADVSFVGAGGQAPIITAKPNAPTTNINPFTLNSDGFVTTNPLGIPQTTVLPGGINAQSDLPGASNRLLSTGTDGLPGLDSGGVPGAGNRMMALSKGKGKGAAGGPPGLANTNGVPPGLAKKGGMPPGLAKKMNAGPPQGGQGGPQ